MTASPILDERRGLSLPAGPSSAGGWNGLTQPQNCNLQPLESVPKMRDAPPCRLQGRFELFFQKMRRSQFPPSKMNRYERPMGMYCIAIRS